MRVRQATPSDLPQLTSLFDGYRVFYRKDSDPNGAQEFLSERMEAEDSVIYVCEDDQEQLTGFVQLYPLFSSTQMKRLWLLNDLYVDVRFRGKGCSVLLIDQAKELVRETQAAGMYLETEKTNDIGNALYPRTGFQLNSVANFYEWHP